MHGRNDIGPRQVQALVIAFQGDGRIQEYTPSEILFRQGEPLDLRSRRPVQAERTCLQDLQHVTTVRLLRRHSLQR